MSFTLEDIDQAFQTYPYWVIAETVMGKLFTEELVDAPEFPESKYNELSRKRDAYLDALEYGYDEVEDLTPSEKISFDILHTAREEYLKKIDRIHSILARIIRESFDAHNIPKPDHIKPTLLLTSLDTIGAFKQIAFMVNGVPVKESPKVEDVTCCPVCKNVMKLLYKGFCIWDVEWNEMSVEVYRCESCGKLEFYKEGS